MEKTGKERETEKKRITNNKKKEKKENKREKNKEKINRESPLVCLLFFEFILESINDFMYFYFMFLGIVSIEYFWGHRNTREKESTGLIQIGKKKRYRKRKKRNN